MDGKWDWDVTVHEDGRQTLDGGIFSTLAGNLVFSFRPEDQSLPNDAASRATMKAKLSSIVDLLSHNMDKV